MAGKNLRKNPLLRQRKLVPCKHFEKDQRPALGFTSRYENIYWCVFCGGIEFKDFKYRFCEERFEKIKSWIGDPCKCHKYPK